MAKPKKVTRTFNVGTRANTKHKRDEIVAQAWKLAVTATGVAIQVLLEKIQQHLVISTRENNGFDAADLLLPLTSPGITRAQELIARPRAAIILDKGVKELNRPRYRNTYRMEEIVVAPDGQSVVRCRIAQRFLWKAEGGTRKGEWVSDVDMIDATIGLQGLLKTWVPIDWSSVPSALRSGACQQTAQQLNSHLGLRAALLHNPVNHPPPALHWRHEQTQKQTQEGLSNS